MLFRIVTFLIICSAPFFLHAKEVSVYFGLMGGLNVSYMEGSEIDALVKKYDSYSESIFSGNGGFRLAYSVKSWLEIESGAYFSGDGFKILLDSESGLDWSGDIPQDVEFNVYMARKVTFLEFPIYLRLQTPYFTGQNVRIYGFGGLRMGIVTKAEEKLIGETITSNFPNQGESVDKDDLLVVDLFKNETFTDSMGNKIHYTYEDFHRRNDLSLALGFGVEKRFDIAGLFIQGHYQYGLFNSNELSDKARKEIADFGTDTTSTNIVILGDPEALYRGFQFSAGFNIYINHKSDNDIKKSSGASKFGY